MSIFSSILRTAYKLSGAKKAFGLPEDEIKKVIEKQNRHRGVFMPTDRKAYYETIEVNGFPCLIVREHPKPSERPAVMCGFRFTRSAWNTVSPRPTTWSMNATAE